MKKEHMAWMIRACLAVLVAGSLMAISGCAASLHGGKRFEAIQAVAQAQSDADQARWAAVQAALPTLNPEARALVVALSAMADGMNTHRKFDISGWDSPAEANITNPTMLLGAALGGFLGGGSSTNTSTNITAPKTIINAPTTTTYAPVGQ